MTKSKSGSPALIHIDSEGRKKQIDSNYDPVGEAARYLGKFKICESINFIAIGLGLGYQVSEIIQQTSKQAKIYIFEKDKDYCLLDEEFARDLKFLDVLSDSVEYLRVNFEKSLSP